MIRGLLCVSFFALAAVCSADTWALLVAGSNGYYNYRHQADVCHSYQILKANGFSDDRIVTMFYDDIAYNTENPVKGNLINQPDGPNVYDGCKKDYTGRDVTPKNFLNILSGKSMDGIGSGKTIQSTADDDVFVFFADHGAVGLIAFPTSMLHASDLNDTIEEMYKNKQYKQMLLYIEACESGSMFNNILSDKINVLAVTASDPSHSSYAIYFDKTRQTYLGDVFSVNWMQDSEAEAGTSETVGQQIDVVTQKTNTSHVCQYGDTSMDSDMLSVFQGKSSGRAAPLPPMTDAVNSRDVTEEILTRRLAAADGEERVAVASLLKEFEESKKLWEGRIQRLAAGVKSFLPPVDILAQPTESSLCTKETVEHPVCLKQMVNAFTGACGELDEVALKHVRVLNAMCNAGVTATQAMPAMVAACSGSTLLV
jgi:legumain